jgi:ribosomal protein S17E
VIIEKYYSRLTLDFHVNKRLVGEVAIVPSKRMRNKIAGFITHLMKRISRGPVRGISLKLQEEERERRLDFVPEVCISQPSFPSVCFATLFCLIRIRNTTRSARRLIRISSLLTRILRACLRASASRTSLAPSSLALPADRRTAWISSIGLCCIVICLSNQKIC